MKKSVGGLMMVAFWAGIPGIVRSDFFGDSRTKRYHAESCVELKTLKAGYRKRFTSEAEAGGWGYYPCPTCVPVLDPAVKSTEQRRKLSRPIQRASQYIGQVREKIYHYPGCRRLGQSAGKGHRTFPGPREALAAGFAPCQECMPPVAPGWAPAEFADPGKPAVDPTAAAQFKTTSGTARSSDIR